MSAILYFERRVIAAVTCEKLQYYRIMMDSVRDVLKTQQMRSIVGHKYGKKLRMALWVGTESKFRQ